MDTQEIEDIIMDRSLDENLQDLVAITRSNNYKLNLITYNSLLTDYFKGLIGRPEFERGKTKIWDAIFFFIKRESAETLDRLAKKIGGVQDDNDKINTILYVAASPKNVRPLQVDYEYSKIEAALQQGTKRDRFQLLRPLLAATLENFLLDRYKHTPSFIHFSGHGTNDGLIFSTNNNEYKLISEEVLDEVFTGINKYGKCVILNACYAAGQAKMISSKGVYVMGMNAPITDAAAVFLSEKFYRALSEGQEIEEAFAHTRTLLRSELATQAYVPELWKDGQQVT